MSPAAQGESDYPSGTLGVEERQASSARREGRALTQELMEQVVDADNLNRAFKRVRANKGAPGIDGMTVEQLGEWARERKEEMIASLLDGSYVRSREAGERVMASVTKFLEGKLKLKVNRDKSAVAHVKERKFLGHRLFGGGGLGIAPKSIERFKGKVRKITRRNRGVKLEKVIEDLNSLIRGWVNYFRHASAKTRLRELDERTRRKVRCCRLKQCKRAWPLYKFLHERGLKDWRAWELAGSSKGWWRKARMAQAHSAMNMKWMEEIGLQSMLKQYFELQLIGNRRMR